MCMRMCTLHVHMHVHTCMCILADYLPNALLCTKHSTHSTHDTELP